MDVGEAEKKRGIGISTAIGGGGWGRAMRMALNKMLWWVWASVSWNVGDWVGSGSVDLGKWLEG